MDYFKRQTSKNPTKPTNKKRLTQDQVHLLETSFIINKKLDADRKFQLAQELNIPPRQIAIWYQNKRARWKNQTLEFGHKSLQERLESALNDNERLEREVKRLQEELSKAQNSITNTSTNILPYNSSVSPLSTSCDEDGSSSFFHDSKICFEKELYACLLGNNEINDQFGKSSDHHDFF